MHLHVDALAAAALIGALAGCAAAPPSRPASGVAAALRIPATPPGHSSWAPWPQAQHDAAHSSSTNNLGPQTGHIRWTRKLEGNVTPGPVIGGDGTVYAASNAGVLHAIDPRTGDDRWSFDGHGSYGSDLSTSPAVLPDGTVLWPGPGGRLFALSPAGRQLWSLTFPAQPTSPSVRVDGRTVYVGDTGGHVSALDVQGKRHRVRWQLALGGTSYSSVAAAPADPARLYQTTDDALVAIDDRGSYATVAWRFRAHSIVEVSPAVAATDGTVILGSNDNFEYAVAPGGRERWRYRRDALTYSSAGVTDDGVTYFGDHRAYLNAVDLKSGRLMARYRGRWVGHSGSPSAEVWTAPAIDREHDVYWGTLSGHVYGRSRTGRQLFDLSLGGATVDSYPALGADGLLVIGVSDGRLLGIGDAR